MSTSTRRLLGQACYVLGTLWVASGVLKAVFGVMITLPILPPLGLERVHEGSAIITGCCLYFAGAWFSRRSAAPISQRVFDDPPGVRSKLEV